jgi:hypothetical protein
MSFPTKTMGKTLCMEDPMAGIGLVFSALSAALFLTMNRGIGLSRLTVRTQSLFLSMIRTETKAFPEKSPALCHTL